MIPFYQRISRIIFKICFSRKCSPSWTTKQTYFGNFTHLPLVAQNSWVRQGSTICVHCIHMSTYFYWHTHNFGHAYVNTYFHFFLMVFLSSVSYNFILFKNLMVYIWPLIYLFVLGRDRFFTVSICFKETLFSNFSYKPFPLLQSTCHIRVSVRK